MIIGDLISTRIYNSYTQADNPGCISDSLLNEYVPFFSAFFAEFKRVGGVRYNIYQTPPIHVNGYGTSPSNKSIYFRTHMSTYVTARGFIKGEHTYQIMKGCIFMREENRDKMLYCLAFKKDYIFPVGVDRNIDFNNLDYTKLVMLLDRTFVESPSMRLMYNYVKKEVLTPLTELGIDTVITNSVNRWCFNDSSSPMTFNTMSEMREFLNNLSNNIIDGITGRQRSEPVATPIAEPIAETESGDTETLRLLNELLAEDEIPESGPGVADVLGEFGELGDSEEGAVDADLESDDEDEDPDWIAIRDRAAEREERRTRRREDQPRQFNQFTVRDEYIAGFDPATTTSSTPASIYIREATGEFNEHGLPTYITREVQPNLTGGIDISYGARRREDIGQPTPVDTYQGRWEPTTPAGQRQFDRTSENPFVIDGEPFTPTPEPRRELSREELWSVPRAEAQSQEEEESSEGDESADFDEDDELPY